MTPHPRLILLLPLCALASSCAPTGDPNQDTILFDRRMGEERLGQRRENLARIDQQTEAERIKQISNKRIISKVDAENTASRKEIASIRSQIAAREREIVQVDTQIGTARAEGADTSSLLAKRASLEKDITDLNRHLFRLLKTS